MAKEAPTVGNLLRRAEDLMHAKPVEIVSSKGLIRWKHNKKFWFRDGHEQFCLQYQRDSEPPVTETVHISYLRSEISAQLRIGRHKSAGMLYLSSDIRVGRGPLHETDESSAPETARAHRLLDALEKLQVILL